MVVNLGSNYALAINYEDGSSPEMPENYRFCDSHCAPHPITEAHWRPRAGEKQKKLQVDEEEEDNKEEEEGKEEEEEEQRGMRERRTKKAPPGERTPKRPKVVDVEALVRAVSGKQAILRFFRLVHNWREYDLLVKRRFKVGKTAMTVNDSAAVAVKMAMTLQDLNGVFKDKTAVSHFGDVLTDAWRAQVIDDFINQDKYGKSTRIEYLLRGLYHTKIIFKCRTKT